MPKKPLHQGQGQISPLSCPSSGSGVSLHEGNLSGHELSVLTIQPPPSRRITLAIGCPQTARHTRTSEYS